MGELQERLTSSEFVEWVAYLELEMNSFHREDFYMAQLAAEIRRGYVKNPNKPKVEDFLITFGMKDVYKKTVKEATRDSKSFWNSLLAVKGK